MSAIQQTKVRVTLSHAQFFTLASWVKEQYEAKNWKQYTEMAAEASKVLGYEVSAYAAKSALDTLGLELKKVPEHDKRRDRMQILAVELATLMRELGKEPSDALMSIVHRKGHKN